MKNRLLTLIVSLSSIVCFSQTAIDFDQIEHVIEDKNSEFYYPKLLERFENGDLNMTIEQKRHCYYGFVFDSNYKPYDRPKGTDMVDTLLKKVTNIDTLKVQSILDSTLAIFPFDFKTLAYRVRYASTTEELEVLKSRLSIIFEAIKSSGNGTSKKTPFQIIHLPHELLVLNKLKLEREGRQSLNKKNIDIIELAENERNIEKIYFDVNIMNANGIVKNILFHQFYHVYLNMHKTEYDVK